MPVLEVTQLRLTSLPASSPTLLKNLSTVRDKLQTSSQFYICVEDSTLLYILGIWPSLAAHAAFLASPERDEVLGPQEDVLQFEWTVHMEIDGMNSLPLDAPILVIERVGVEDGFVSAFEQAATRRVQLRGSSRLFKVAQGWRCDAAVGSHEAIVFSGWDSVQAHAATRARQEGDDKYVRSILVHHLRDLEHQEV